MKGHTHDLTPLLVCEHCDAVYQRVAMPPRQRALCRRCGAELAHHRRYELQRLLALTISGIVVLVIANAWPLVTLDMQGVSVDRTLWGAIRETWHTGVGAVAVLSALTLFFFPLAQLLILSWVLAHLYARRDPPGFVDLMHALRLLRPWSMVEVFMLGVVVALVKMAGVAVVKPEVGVFAFGALALLLTLLNSIDLHSLWTEREGLR